MISFTAFVILLLQVAWIHPSGASRNGEEAGRDNVLLEGYEGWKYGEVYWSDPPDKRDWELCKKVTVVFGVAVCATEQAWNMKPECDFIVNVFYQLLDNDQDGVPNDKKVVSELVQKGYLFMITKTPSDFELNLDEIPRQAYEYQPTFAVNAIPNSCDYLVNRGASATDRSTWETAANTENADCVNEMSHTFEDIFHLINSAAAVTYPEKWGKSFDSGVGAEIKRLNGNCGWGFTNNWIDPSSGQCAGHFAYNEGLCDEECVVMDGTYWAAITYVGGIYTVARCEDAKNEWLMCTPDDNMSVYPTGVNNALSLQKGSALLYEMISDNTLEGHKWLPKIMPDGKYTGFDNAQEQMPWRALRSGI